MCCRSVHVKVWQNLRLGGVQEMLKKKFVHWKDSFFNASDQLPEKKNTRRNLVCWPRCFSIRACPFTALQKNKNCRGDHFPVLPHPLRPSLPRDAEQQTQRNMLPLSSENCIFFGEAQHARWTLSGSSKGHTTILLSLFAVDLFKQNIWGDHFPSFARRKINQWSNLRKTHTYPHAHEPSTATKMSGKMYQSPVPSFQTQQNILPLSSSERCVFLVIEFLKSKIKRLWQKKHQKLSKSNRGWGGIGDGVAVWRCRERWFFLLLIVWRYCVMVCVLPARCCAPPKYNYSGCVLHSTQIKSQQTRILSLNHLYALPVGLLRQNSENLDESWWPEHKSSFSTNNNL